MKQKLYGFLALATLAGTMQASSGSALQEFTLADQYAITPRMETIKNLATDLKDTAAETALWSNLYGLAGSTVGFVLPYAAAAFRPQTMATSYTYYTADGYVHVSGGLGNNTLLSALTLGTLGFVLAHSIYRTARYFHFGWTSADAMLKGSDMFNKVGWAGKINPALTETTGYINNSQSDETLVENYEKARSNHQDLKQHKNINTLNAIAGYCATKGYNEQIQTDADTLTDALDNYIGSIQTSNGDNGIIGRIGAAQERDRQVKLLEIEQKRVQAAEKAAQAAAQRARAQQQQANIERSQELDRLYEEYGTLGGFFVAFLRGIQ